MWRKEGLGTRETVSKRRKGNDGRETMMNEWRGSTESDGKLGLGNREKCVKIRGSEVWKGELGEMKRVEVFENEGSESIGSDRE